MTDNAGRYFKKRLARIVPGFLLASLLVLFVFGPLGADNIGDYFQHINWRANFVCPVSASIRKWRKNAAPQSHENNDGWNSLDDPI